MFNNKVRLHHIHSLSTTYKGAIILIYLVLGENTVMALWCSVSIMIHACVLAALKKGKDVGMGHLYLH